MGLDCVGLRAQVYVKVMSTTGSKISLSMRDADQATGKDLCPAQKSTGSAQQGAVEFRNPSRPVGRSNVSGVNFKDDDETTEFRRPVKRLSSPELWEAKQLISSGVLDIRDYPTFDDSTGLAPNAADDDEVNRSKSE